MEQVLEFEQLMKDCGCEEPARPLRCAGNTPWWHQEGRPRREGEDPLAAVIFTIYNDSKEVLLDSGYRSVTGQQIEPEMMKLFILTNYYSKQNS